MSAFRLLASALLLGALLGPPAFAQQKKGAAPSPATTIRYFQFSGDLLGDLPIDAVLKETRQGGKVVSAVLDVCHPIPNAEPRKDLFVVDLKVEGDRLTGTGQSREEKTPIAVSLTRRQTGRTLAFSGSITRGQSRTEVNSADNNDMSEDEFRDNQPAEELIVPAPADFTEVSPGSIALRVRRAALVAVVNELKGAGAAVEYDGLATGCATLRSGEHVVRAEIDPERAAALVAKLQGLPGVTSAGWTNGDYIVDNAVRLAGDGWRGADGRPDKGRLAAAIAASLAKALAATVDAATWDTPGGELSLKLLRPNQVIPQFRLTDVFEFVATVGPEKPGAAGALVVWLRYNGFDTVDRGPEPRLKFLAAGGDREGPVVNLEEIMRALARDLAGQYWDSGGSAWR